MKILYLLALSLLLTGCANAQSEIVSTKLDVVGNSLPSIRHITEMKVFGDTLLFVYDSEGGYGQRYLRRAVIDLDNNKLDISSDMGKREGGYYVSYMPYPFIASDGTIRVVSQDDCGIYTVESDTAFVRTKQYLMGTNCPPPLPLSQYVQDVFMTAPDKYVFIGREPNGGRQYSMTADLTLARIDTIKQVYITPELQTWMPNMGEMSYSEKYNYLAFAYKLHPTIEIFGKDGSVINNVKVAEPTFDFATLEEADFEDLNPLHFVDITTNDYIYALYWGYKFSQYNSPDANSSIYKIDWEGNIINQYSLNAHLKNIAVYNNDILIGWTGNEFIVIRLT